MVKIEAKVGIFVFIALIFLFALSSQVAKFGSFGKDGYKIFGHTQSVLGLEKNSKVKINGIEGGYVENLEIEGKTPKITLFIYKNITLPKDSVMTLSKDSLLGSKLVEITIGNQEEFLKEGEVINSKKEFASFDEASQSINDAAIEFKKFMEELRSVLDENSREDLKKTFDNFAQITEDLKIFLNQSNLSQTLENFNNMAISVKDAGDKFGLMSQKLGSSADTLNQRLPSIVEKVDSFVASFDSIGKNLDKDLPVVLEKFSKLEDDLSDVIAQNKEPLNGTLENAKGFFGKGEDAIEKVDKYLDSMANSQLEVSLRTDFMTKDEFSKSYFSLAYRPNPTRYYLFEAVSSDDFSKTDMDGNFIEPKKHEKGELYILAQVGKRYDNFLFRGGITESTGGLGIDYFLQDDKLKASFDLFDFNAQNDIRGENAHAKATIRYTMLKHIDFYIGYDNFLNKESDNIFAGFGVNFVDDDLKNLLGSGSVGSFLK